MTAFSTTIGSFVNAAALRIVSELAKPVERSASVPKRPLLFMLASVLQAASKNPQRHDLSERDARAPTAPSGPRHTPHGETRLGPAAVCANRAASN